MPLQAHSATEKAAIEISLGGAPTQGDSDEIKSKIARYLLTDFSANEYLLHYIGLGHGFSVCIVAGSEVKRENMKQDLISTSLSSTARLHVYNRSKCVREE